ncbi:MAG: tRNA (N6-isopentenyl adenosine(37)-C2)-methylthiotransferase MiaB [Christensenellales bacterium]
MQEYYKIVTFGCQMNVHESEKLAGTLEELGYKPTEDDNKADVIVFNTCCVREAAEHKALGNIGALKPLKKQKKDLIIAVCGCMAQQKEMAEKIYKTFPFVNIVFGTHNSFKFKEYLQNVKQQKKRVYQVVDDDGKLPVEVKSYRTSGYNAWVNITYGCNNFCSYCIVPYVRGRERSRPMQDIVNECKMLIAEGYKVVTLLGQNVNSYGNTFNNGKDNFAELLKAVDGLQGDFIIKFLTSHPKDLSEEVVKTIATSKHISHMIHLPVQSGSDRILKLMNRNYTTEHYLKTIEMIKKYLPDVNLSTDIIVGFPTETEQDFQATLDLLKKVQYNTVFGFMYSKRSGTPAASFDGQVLAKDKKERVNRLLALQRQIEQQKLKRYLGKEITVLMTERKSGKVFAKTDCGINVIIENATEFKVDFVKVKITDIKNTKLIAQIV